MKRVFFLIALVAIVTSVEAQIYIQPNGSVGIGTNYVWSSDIRLQVDYGGNSIAVLPNMNGPCIGAYQAGESVARLDFWHPTSMWNKVKFKGYSLSSDSTMKTDIVPLTNATNVIKQIKTYSYYYKSDPIESRKRDYGVLAQELENILPELTDTARGNMFVNYNAFFAILIKGFNEQQTVIDTQQAKINQLQVENTQQQAEVNQLKTENAQQQAEIEILQKIAFGQELDLTELYELREKVTVLQNMLNMLWDAMKNCCTDAGFALQQRDTSSALNNKSQVQQLPILYQNTPNSFSSNTEINYYIPTASSNAFIYVYNLQGVELKSFPATQGLNTVTIYASELPAGMYLYTLVVDNVIIDYKRMILTK